MFTRRVVSFLVGIAALAACASGGGGAGGTAGLDAGVGGGDASGGASTDGAAASGGVGGAAAGGSGGSSAADSGATGGTAGDASGACGDAIDITADLKSAKYSGSATALATDPISCAGAAPRLYLQVTLEAGNYSASLSTPAGASDPSAPDAAMAIRADCADPASELACNDKALFLNPKFSLAKTGTVYVLIDGQAFANGFDLSIWQTSKSCFSCSSYQQCHPSGACVECTSADDCASGAVCDPDWAYCRLCQSSADCTQHPNGATCDASTGLCGCASSSDCKGTNQACGAASVCIECKPGFVDCNGAAYDGCESNPASDPENCGTCGKSCQGGACNNGVCSPAPELVIDDKAALLAVDDTDVFYTSSESVLTKWVKRVAPTGGPATQIAKMTDNFEGLAIDASKVYFTVSVFATDPDPIFSVPRSGGTPTQIGSQSATYAPLLQVDAGQLYYRSGPSSAGNAVFRIPLTGGSATKIVDGVDYFALSASHVVYPNVVSSGLSDLYAVPKSGGAPSLVATKVADCTEMAADGSDVYFIGPDARSLSRVPVGGGTPQVLLASTSHPFAGCLNEIRIGVDAIYVTAGAQTSSVLLEIPKAGGPYSLIASIQKLTDMALSSTHIYWADDGAIRRLAL